MKKLKTILTLIVLVWLMGGCTSKPMEFHITGIAGAIITVVVLTLLLIIVLLGAWIILNVFIWEFLIRYSMLYLKEYKLFMHFIRYHNRYKKWAEKYEGKIEEGAND